MRNVSCVVQLLAQPAVSAASAAPGAASKGTLSKQPWPSERTALEQARQGVSLLTVLALIGVVALVALLLVLRRLRGSLHSGSGASELSASGSKGRKKRRKRVSAWEESERRLFMNKPAGFAPGSDDDTVDMDPSDIGPEDIGPGTSGGEGRPPTNPGS